ncbi:unnamed protein product [Brassica oleracea var. botrytis]
MLIDIKVSNFLLSFDDLADNIYVDIKGYCFSFSFML